ncbi:hypothetical protein LEP1GSC188_1638 [Leptospira weilii serovar Topaz str. LT2116]|uniref:Uncharacterized protein n=1 Tax=Leptospira weilii serovar Topaz str. LT2116 TaxID=1088540 RepID=M3GSW0_9LEPT|nr:hypothetical protein LEP1GSC188_1638 [Leptospira weilii serovar Topaz str. LT2116]
MNLPKTYKALELREYGENKNRLAIVDKTIRPLKKGEVLIRMHSAPINPSDLMFLRGLYGIKKNFRLFRALKEVETLSLPAAVFTPLI